MNKSEAKIPTGLDEALGLERAALLEIEEQIAVATASALYGLAIERSREARVVRATIADLESAYTKENDRG